MPVEMGQLLPIKITRCQKTWIQTSLNNVLASPAIDAAQVFSEIHHQLIGVSVGIFDWNADPELVAAQHMIAPPPHCLVIQPSDVQ